MTTYNLKSLSLQNHDTSYGGFKFKYVAVINVDAKEFKKLKGDLGNLVLKLNNDLYNQVGVPAHHPTVGGMHNRASKGLKTLEFTYYSNDTDKAESFGVQMLRFKSGEVTPKEYRIYVDLLKQSNVIQFKKAV